MAVDHNNPQSRTEEILIATIDGNEYNKLPQSRLEELLLELKQVIEAGGGGGGTTNYNLLSNLPKINNITVKGEMTASDLSLVLAEVGKGLSTNDYSDEEKAKVADLITAIEGILTGTDLDSFGDVETALADKVDKVNGKGLSTNDFTDEYKAAIGSNTSAITAIKDGSELDSFGDVEVALLDKADTSDLGTAAAKDSTNSVSAGSTDLVESGAVKDAIDAAVASAYHHAGTKTVAQLTHDLLIAANEGNVYNITDSGTTTSDFIEGIGKQIDAGDNVGICKVGNVYMFDLLSGLEDTSLFVQKSQTSGLLKNDGTVNTTIENTVAGHTTAINGKQDTLTFDDTPTDGSNNPVKSNGIYDSEKDIYAAMGEMGAKNLIPYPYYESNHTESGITWTVNSDGSITANGTATENSTFILRYRTEQTKFVEKNTSYILSGCPSGGSNSTYSMALFVKNQDDSNIANGADFGDGITINMPNKDYYGIYMFARVFSGQTVSNLTFKPMLRLASDTDGTYQPYAKTNKQLTDDVTLLDSEKTDTDIVASDFSTAVSYTAGDYCIYGGKFYKFKNNHSGAWSASDVDEIKIAGELSSLKSGLTSVINHNKIIYMNDSFGENVTPNISTLVPSQMGWTSADYYGIVKGGSGFGSSAPYNYLTLLQNNASSIASHFDDVDDVSDVIVTGGTNDSYYGDSDTVIKNGISEFANYVNQTYPNAKITLIFTGWADSSGVVTNLTFSNIKRAIVDYEYICQLGGRFFDLHNILHQHSLFNGDHIHPTVVAQHMIADAITSLLKGGEYHVVRTLDVNVVPASGVTVTNGPISLRFTQTDNIITACINRSSGFWHFTTTAIASTPAGELNNILLGTFSDWIIGSNETGENKLITNCVVGFDGGAKVIPVIFTFENGNIYYGLGNYDTTSKSYTVNACGAESVSFSSYNC